MEEELSQNEKQALALGLILDRKKLAKSSKSIGKIESEDLYKLTDKMMKVLIAMKAYGIAAPQLGVFMNVFLMYMPDGEIETVINGEILKEYWQKEAGFEACLSLPDGKQRQVLRSKKIDVKYMNIEDNEIIEKERRLEGIYARIYAHEWDHLQGILYTDRV